MNSNFSLKKTVSAKELFRQAEFNNILKCVHCGLCLDYCPTYRELGDEKDSPRGRLYLMRGLWGGELELNNSVIEPLSRCLDCRACESACPSGVPYGELLEKTRGIILENTAQSFKEKLLRVIFLRGIFRSTNLLIMVSRLLRIYVASGLPKLITQTFIRKLFPKSFVFKQFLLPNFSGQSFKLKYADKVISPFIHRREIDASSQIKRSSFRVGIFSGCIMDVSESKIHDSTLTFLRTLGCEVFIPSDQSCCGALHVHSGDRKSAREFALKNLSAFGHHNLDAIITNAAGCGAQLKEYHLLFANQTSQTKKEWSNFEEKFIDVMEFLSRYEKLLENIDWREDEETILYDAPCHLIHAQQVDKNPQKILKSLPGVRLIALEDSDSCCGSAGIYNITNPELSVAILNRKTKSIRKALDENNNVSSIVTGNPGCLYQIRAGIKINNINLRVLHPIVFLASRLKNVES